MGGGMGYLRNGKQPKWSGSNAGQEVIKELGEEGEGAKQRLGF
jgi:hypothetical protein